MTSSHIIGFDLRLPAESYLDIDWSDERRRRFLLRPELRQPLSADRMTWPSLFEFPGCHLLASPDTGRVPFETNDHRERCSLLWASLPRMAAALPPDLRSLAGRCDTVRIDLESDSPIQAGDIWGYVLDDPIHIAGSGADEWQFLGYDVADPSFCSALTNCGYRPEEYASIAIAWAPKLNDMGLFWDRRDADGFRALSDRRIREHAPFFTLALYRRRRA